MVSKKRTKRKARQAARAKAREEEKRNGGNNQTMTNNNKQQAEAQLEHYPGSPEWNDIIEAKARIEFEKKIGKPSVAVGDAAYLEWLQKTDLYSSHFDNPPFTSLAELCFDRQLKEEMLLGEMTFPHNPRGQNEKNDG